MCGMFVSQPRFLRGVFLAPPQKCLLTAPRLLFLFSLVQMGPALLVAGLAADPPAAARMGILRLSLARRATAGWAQASLQESCAALQVPLRRLLCPPTVDPVALNHPFPHSHRPSAARTHLFQPTRPCALPRILSPRPRLWARFSAAASCAVAASSSWASAAAAAARRSTAPSTRTTSPRRACSAAVDTGRQLRRTATVRSGTTRTGANAVLFERVGRSNV